MEYSYFTMVYKGTNITDPRTQSNGASAKLQNIVWVSAWKSQNT